MTHLRKIALITATTILLGVLIWLVDPLEQIHRFQDHRLERDAEELLEAVDYCYKKFFEYPWNVLGRSDPTGETVHSSWLQELVDKEIVASSFATRSYWDRVFVSLQDDALYACFSPLSQEFKRVANTQGRGKDGSTGCTESCAYYLVKSF